MVTLLGYALIGLAGLSFAVMVAILWAFWRVMDGD